MAIEWGTLLEGHQDAWDTAKELLGVTNCLDLSLSQSSDLAALAEEIRKGRVNVNEFRKDRQQRRHAQRSDAKA